MSAAGEVQALTAAPRFRRRKVEYYLRLGRAGVKGWLAGLDARLIADIGRIQTEQGITGSVGEIGVHHGKLFILLYLLTHREEAAFCVDVFDMQHLNVDRSGSGSESVFLANLARYAGADARVHVIKASSDTVSASDITTACGPVRIFSIDGGHTAALTKNDLQLAAPTLCEGGIVIIDDYFQPTWPGVSEGVIKFFQHHPDELVPFAISINKVFLCRPTHATLYGTRLAARNEHVFAKDSELMGHPVAIYRPPSLRHRLRNTPLWQIIRYTPAGRAIKSMAGHFHNN